MLTLHQYFQIKKSWVMQQQIEYQGNESKMILLKHMITWRQVWQEIDRVMLDHS